MTPLARRTLLAAGAALLLAPLSVVDIPPLLDYPNHLAKLWLLAFGAADPVIAKVYSTHWSIIGNLGVELAMPPLLAFIPLYWAGKIFLALALLLPWLGAVALNRASLPGRSAWPLTGCLVAYNSLFLLGFMNFLIGLGLGMLGAAGWIAWRDRRPALVIGLAVPGAAALFFVHLFGLALFGLLIGAHEAVRLAGWNGAESTVAAPVTYAAPLRWPGAVAIVRRAAPLAAVFAVPAALYLTSGIADAGGPSQHLSLRIKLGELAGPFLNYFQTPDRLVALAVVGCVAVCIALRRASVSPPVAIVAVALLLLWPFVPHVYKTVGYISARLPIMLGFLLFAGFAPRLPRRVGLALGSLAALVFVARMAVVTQVWRGHQADLAQLRQTIAPIEPGKWVLAVDVPMAEVIPLWLDGHRSWMTAGYQKTYYHLAALVLPERRAFWPRLFAGVGKQPVAVNPAYDALTAQEGELPDFRELANPAPSAVTLREAPYLPGWDKKFDYVLVLAAAAAGPGLDGFLPERLKLVVRTPFAALFRVKRGPG